MGSDPTPLKRRPSEPGDWSGLIIIKWIQLSAPSCVAKEEKRNRKAGPGGGRFVLLTRIDESGGGGARHTPTSASHQLPRAKKKGVRSAPCHASPTTTAGAPSSSSSSSSSSSFLLHHDHHA
jgi:hypothetical protein